MTVLLPPFQFGCLLLLLLIWLLWLRLPIWCWIEVVRADTLVLFLILVGKLLILSVDYDVGCRCFIYALYYVEACFLYSFAEHFYHKWVLYFIKCFSPIYRYDDEILVFSNVYVMYYICWFDNNVSSLHPWDECHLIMVYDLFNVLLDAISQYFVEDFSVYVHQRYRPVIFFLCCVFIWFGD